MAQLMAGFGQGFVQTQVLSENNSVKYKLSVAGSNATSLPNPAYILLNDKPISSIQHQNGLNVWELDTTIGAIVYRKIYTFGINDSASANIAFIEYMNSITADTVIIITTSGNVNSSPSVDNWFKNAGSTNWFNNEILRNYKGSYAGIYRPRFKKVVSENRCYTDGSIFDSRAYLEIVYDTINDIGATGFPYRVCFDTNEYKTDSEIDIKRYPNGLFVTPYSDYLMSPGQKYMISFELFASASLISSGKTTQMNIRWFNDNAFVSGSSYEVNSTFGDQWVKFERIIDVPANTNGFTIVASRTNSVLISDGTSGVRNVIMAQVSRGDVPITSAAFGVNGIRMNKGIDGTTDKLLILPDVEDDPTGDIYSAEFIEVAPL
ncbi:tail connector protein [Yersinia phage vB_YenM_TG1]|uniref:Tail connector protein n=1 Tax=Yersinia phage vB_YenM_TG1 TaxID=1589265 RepID=A0A0B4ZZQ6_9CAUD|nr:long tail fiber protein proximal connector [Yersinia phage vB_YenM_TG1]AJD82058.1 tail connector protein [Yersinia phage vB_YenM_TG1]